MRKFFAPITVLVIMMVIQTGATVVTSIPGGTVIAMPAIDYFGSGPATFGAGSFAGTWTSTNSFNNGGSVFGYSGTFGPYVFGGNGQWTGVLGPMAGLNDSFDDPNSGVTDTMTFSFAKPVSAVGGLLNYVPGASTPTTIAVYDSHGNLIEAPFTLTFLTGGGNDSGSFFGFSESTANISYFTLTDNFVGITNLTAAVPEPSSLLLIGTGLLGLVGYSRRCLSLKPISRYARSEAGHP